MVWQLFKLYCQRWWTEILYWNASLRVVFWSAVVQFLKLTRDIVRGLAK